MKHFITALVLALVTIGSANATVTANTVTVERIMTSNVGAAMASHVYTL